MQYHLIVTLPIFLLLHTGLALTFKKAGESAEYFSHAYGYAVFPTIGKGGIGSERTVPPPKGA